MVVDASCREASKLLSLACDRTLSAEEALALRDHLDRCLMCRNFSDQLDFLRRASERFRGGSA